MSAMPLYRRVLIKMSGEALAGEAGFGIEPKILQRLAAETAELATIGVQTALVIGGGNIFRGAALSAARVTDRVAGDQMGMLATVINAVAMQNAIRQAGCEARVMSAFTIATICEDYVRDEAVRHLIAGRIVIFAGGTSNPLFTTDSAASLRAVEIGADLMIKATKVDGVYSADPVIHPDAKRYEQLEYDDIIRLNLTVMDTIAAVLCRDHDMPLRVLDITKQGSLMRAVCGEHEGTLVFTDKAKKAKADYGPT
jgi:uridylate kinase